jgi:hypothetical protein
MSQFAVRSLHALLFDFAFSVRYCYNSFSLEYATVLFVVAAVKLVSFIPATYLFFKSMYSLWNSAISFFFSVNVGSRQLSLSTHGVHCSFNGRKVSLYLTDWKKLSP